MKVKAPKVLKSIVCSSKRSDYEYDNKDSYEEDEDDDEVHLLSDDDDDNDVMESSFEDDDDEDEEEDDDDEKDDDDSDAVSEALSPMETPSSNLSAFKGVKRLVMKHRNRRQAEAEAAAAAEAAAEALGKDLEAMGYDLNCTSFIKRGQSSEDMDDHTRDERYSLIGEQSDDENNTIGDADLILSLRSASDVVIAARQALLSEHVESLPDVQASYLAEESAGSSSGGTGGKRRSPVKQVLSSGDASSVMGPELPTPSVAAAAVSSTPSAISANIVTSPSIGNNSHAASAAVTTFHLKEELDDDNNYQFIVNNNEVPKTSTSKSKDKSVSNRSKRSGSQSEKISPVSPDTADSDSPLPNASKDGLSPPQVPVENVSHPPSIDMSSQRFFPRASTGLSLRSIGGGILKSPRHYSRNAPTTVPSSYEPSSSSASRRHQGVTESSLSRDDHPDGQYDPSSSNSVIQGKSLKNEASMRQKAPSKTSHPGKVLRPKGVKLLRGQSSVSQAKSLASFWTRNSKSIHRQSEQAVTTETVDSRDDDRSEYDASTFASSRVNSHTTMQTPTEPNRQSSLDDFNDRSDASALSEPLQTETSFSHASKTSAADKAKKAGSKRSVALSRRGIPPTPTGTASQLTFPTAETLDKLVMGLERNSGGFSTVPTEHDGKSLGSMARSNSNAIIIDGMEVVQARAKSTPSPVGGDDDDEDDKTAQDKEVVARKIIELNSEEIKRRAQRALRSKLTRAKLRDLALDRQQKIREYSSGAASSLSRKSIQEYSVGAASMARKSNPADSNSPSVPLLPEPPNKSMSSLSQALRSDKPTNKSHSSLSQALRSDKPTDPSTSSQSQAPRLDKPTNHSLSSLSQALRSDNLSDVPPTISEMHSADDAPAVEVQQASTADADKSLLEGTILSDETPKIKGGAKLFSFRSFNSSHQKRQQKVKSEPVAKEGAGQKEVVEPPVEDKPTSSAAPEPKPVLADHPTIPKCTDAPADSLGFFRNDISPHANQLHVDDDTISSRLNPSLAPTIDTSASPVKQNSIDTKTDDLGSANESQSDIAAKDSSLFATLMADEQKSSFASVLRRQSSLSTVVAGPRATKKRVKFSLFRKRSKDESLKPGGNPIEQKTNSKPEIPSYAKFVATVEDGTPRHIFDHSSFSDASLSLPSQTKDFADFGSFVSEEGVEIRYDDDSTKSLFLYPSLAAPARFSCRTGPILSKIEEEDSQLESQLEDATISGNNGSLLSQAMDNGSCASPAVLREEQSALYDNVELSFSTSPPLGEMSPHFGNDEDHLEPTFEIVLGSREAFSPISILPSQSSMATSPGIAPHVSNIHSEVVSERASTVHSEVVSERPSGLDFNPSSAAVNIASAESSVYNHSNRNLNWTLQNLFATETKSFGGSRKDAASEQSAIFPTKHSMASSTKQETIPNRDKPVAWGFSDYFTPPQVSNNVAREEVVSVPSAPTELVKAPVWIDELSVNGRSESPAMEPIPSLKSARTATSARNESPSLFESVDKWFNGSSLPSPQLKAEIEVQRTRSLLDQRRSSASDDHDENAPVATDRSVGKKKPPTGRPAPPKPEISTIYSKPSSPSPPLASVKADQLQRMTRVGSILRREPSSHSRQSREKTMDYINSQLEAQEEHSYPSIVDPRKHPEEAALHRQMVENGSLQRDPLSMTHRIPSNLVLSKRDIDESSCLTSLQSTLASRKVKDSDSSSVYTFGQADRHIWKEIAEASHIVEEALRRVGPSGVSDGKTGETSIGDEVERALQILKGHAERLGVKESELLLAVNSHEETSAAESMGGSAVKELPSGVGEDDVRVVLTQGYSDTFSLEDSDKSMTIGEELIEALKTYLAPQTCTNKKREYRS